MCDCLGTPGAAGKDSAAYRRMDSVKYPQWCHSQGVPLQAAFHPVQVGTQIYRWSWWVAGSFLIKLRSTYYKVRFCEHKVIGPNPSRTRGQKSCLVFHKTKLRYILGQSKKIMNQPTTLIFNLYAWLNNKIKTVPLHLYNKSENQSKFNQKFTCLKFWTP